MDFYQIGILFFQGALVSILILLLFGLRKKFGIGMLFACIGLFQFMQVFLSSTVYVAIAPNFLVSPGSAVLFTATLFAILLIYIKEDSSETRKIIYALLIVNIIMSVLLQTFGWNIEESSTYNPFQVSTKLFNNNAWVLFVGTMTLFIDSLLIIVLYEFISKFVKALFFKICLTMILVVIFDTTFFSIVAFWNYDNLGVIFASGIISKSTFAIFYSIPFYIYLKFFERNSYQTDNLKIKDVFHSLSYKQKFEITTKEKENAIKAVHIEEIKFQTLASNSPVGIFQTRSDGFTTYVNPRWSEISGISYEQALGNDWYNAVHPDDRTTLNAAWEHAVRLKSKATSEYRFLKPDGSIRWVLGQAVPELNSEQEIIGYVGTITDITEIKLFQEEQVRLRKKAEESERLKSAFLANMSHEIRTPMNGILGFTELLLAPDLDSEKKEKYIKIVQKSGLRLLNTVNDIIEFSKIEAGLVSLNMQKTDIKKMLEEIIQFFLLEIKQKGLTLKPYTLPSEEEGSVSIDQNKFNSIVTNLIKNAIKYTKEGSIEIGCENKNNQLEFFVRDTGIGIPKDRLKAIFERFMQADIEDKQAFQGSGLGLAISKAYLEMMGGQIWVESELGSGSCFHFSLPIT
jgi:PAS domain S-box-containing protein